MSQHDLDIANQGFPATRADLNLALKALGSSNSGATAPSTTYANQLWYDTANNILKIRNEDNDAFISLFTLDQSADAVTQIDVDNIRIDGNTISSTDTNGDITLTPNGTGEVNLVDNDKLTFGAGSDMQIFHNGSASVINDVGTGDLYLGGDNNVLITNAALNEIKAQFVSNGAAELYHDNSKKFETTSTGIDVTGSAVMTGTDTFNSNASGAGILLKDSGVTSRQLHIAAPGSVSEAVIGTPNSHNLTFATNSIERMRLSGAGDFQVSQNGTVNTGGTVSGVNISAQYGTFQANFHGNEYPILNIHTSGANNRYFDFRFANSSVGNITTNGSTTSYNTSSDYRLKEAVVDMTGAIDRVKALAPKRFNFIVDADTTVDGFLAHEAQSVVPEAVTGTKDAMMDEDYVVNAATGDIYTPAAPATYDEDGEELTAATDEVIHSSDVENPEELGDGQQWRETTAAVMGTRSVPDYQGIDQSKLVPLLTGALREAIAKIESLETRVAALEA
jgi:hypothetical protein